MPLNWQTYHSAGINIIPIKADGSKAPAVKWAQYKDAPADTTQLGEWFGAFSDFTFGMAAVCGSSSRDLLCIDFDDPATYEPWLDKVNHIVSDTPHVRTPKGGYHVWIRAAGIGGNQKLARAADKSTRIETRANGGYALLPGSPAACHPSGKTYELIHGSFDRIKVLTSGELMALFAAAMDFDEYQECVISPEKRKVSAFEADDDAPGTAFNARGDVRSLLEKHGWKLIFSRGDVDYWRRPGKTANISASFGFKGCNCLYVFSSNATPFEPEHSYTPFAVYTLLEYGGDYHAAAEALLDKGYGVKQETKTLILGTGSAQDAQIEPSTSEPDDKVTQLINAIKLTLNYALEPQKCWELWTQLSDAEQISARYKSKIMRIDRDMFNAAINVGKPVEEPKHYIPSALKQSNEPDPEEMPLLGQVGYGAFVDGYSHLVVSKPRIGKSELVSQCMGYWARPTTYLSEEGKRIWARRIRALSASGLEIPDCCEIVPDAAGGRAYVLNLIETMAPGHVLVIDTLRAYFEISDECDGGQVTQSILPLIQAVKRRCVTLVVIHHSRKSGGDDAIDASSGSNALPGLFDAVLHLEAKGEALKLAGKVRGGMVRNAMMQWENNLLKIIDPQVAKQLTLSDKILEVIPAYDFIDIDGIIEALGDDATGKESIRRRVYELVSEGNIISEKSGNIGRGSKQRWTKAGAETLEGSD